MNAKRCDRCKKFYLESDDSLERPSYAGVRIYSVELKSNGGNYIKGYDLCTDCAKKLYSFLKGRNEVPIPEPFINKPCISEGVCHEDKMQVLDKLRAELIQSIQNGTLKIESGNEELFRIIDKYRTESEVNDDGNS